MGTLAARPRSMTSTREHSASVYSCSMCPALYDKCLLPFLALRVLLCFRRDNDENIDASNDPEPIMVGEEEATSNPACQAILASEVGLASADFQDDRLRTG